MSYMIVQLKPKELKEMFDKKEEIKLIDVREEWEHHLTNLENSDLIPLGLFHQRFAELSPNQKVVIYCHHGIRSYQACLYLEKVGFSEVYNLDGGIDAWSKEVDNSVPTY